MAQRHQIYVKLPKKYYNPNNLNNKDSRVIGIHHQWCWGKRALTFLKKFVTFCVNAERYNYLTRNDDEAIDLVNAIYSIDTDKGEYHPTCSLEDGETNDPRNADNNNGITIIDLSDLTDDKCKKSDRECLAKIKYAFLSLGYLECLSDDIIEIEGEKTTISDHFNENKKFHLQPMNAEQWIRLHYPYPNGDFNCEADCVCKRDKALEKLHRKQNEENEKEIQELIAFFQNPQFKSLSLDEVKAIFPKMYGVEEAKLETPKAKLKAVKTPKAKVSKPKKATPKSKKAKAFDLQDIGEKNYYGWPDEIYPAIENKAMLFVYNFYSDFGDMGIGGGDFTRADIVEQTDRMIVVKPVSDYYLASKQKIKIGDRLFIGAAGFRKGVAVAIIHDIVDGNLVIGSMTGNLATF